MTLMIPALPPYNAPYEPVSNITPFTYRDGLTYLEVLEGLRGYIRDVVVPFVDTEFASLGNEFTVQVNTMIDTVNAALASQSGVVNGDIAALTTLVNNTVTAIGVSLAAANTAATNAAASAATAGTGASNAAASAAAAATSLSNLNSSADIPLIGAGIDPTGATDSSAAIQAILNANTGRRFKLPVGVFLLNTGLTLSKGQTLRGGGQQDWRDRTNYFGDAAYLVNANYNGTVIRYSGAAGAAITILDATVNSGGVEDFTLIGPGSGTAVGLVIGSAAMSVVNANVRRVKIANFFTGMQTFNLDEGVFEGLMVRGCTSGVILDQHTNNNSFNVLDIQKCGTGLQIVATSYGNAFYSLIAQGCTGEGAQIYGNSSTFYNPYFEANATRNIHVFSGAKTTVIDAPMITTNGDSIMIDSGALYTSIRNHYYNTAALITNAGTGTYIQGVTNPGQLVDTGTGTVLIDNSAPGSAFGASVAMTTLPTLVGITLGNGTLTAKQTKIGKRLLVEIKISLGTTSAVTGPVTLTGLPSTINWEQVNALYIKGSNAAAFQGFGYINNSGTITLGVLNSATNGLTALSATVPLTWSATDFINVSYVIDTP